jgi:hypothetical protein
MARFLREMACCAAAVAAVLAAGCESKRSAVSAEARAAAVKVDPDAYATLGYRLEWRGFPAMNEGGRMTFMEVLGDVVACQESSSLVTLLDARSGMVRCSDQLANPLTKFVGINRWGSRIVISSETDAYFLSADTCTLVDRHDLGKVVTTRPALVAGLLCYGTATGEIVGHMAERAINLWGNSTVGDIVANPLAIGTMVAFVSQGGEVVILDATTGSSLGRARLEGGVAPDDAIGGPMAASDTSLFVASLDQSLYGFDLRTGRRLWRVRTDTPLRTHPVYHDGVLYCDLPSQGLTAFDPGTGRTLWVARGVPGTAVAVRRGRLIVFDRASSSAVTLDPASGDTIDRARLPGVTIIRTDQFRDGNLYTGTANGVVSKFVPRT